MIGKRVLIVTVTMAVLVACAKNGITLNPKPATVAPPKPAVKVARVSEPVVEPPVAETIVAEVETTPVVPEAETEITAVPEPTEEIILASLPVANTAPAKRPRKLLDLIAPTKKPTKHDGVSASCESDLSTGIPARAGTALAGSEVVRQSMTLSGTARDQFISEQLLAGNVPSFLRNLTPVTFTGLNGKGETVEVTICVTPDYLAVGDDRDFVRVPMGLPAAAEVANGFGFTLPTTKMVDAIYTQAGLRLNPSPMEPGSQMSSTNYLWQHNQTVESQRNATKGAQEILVAGQKKDLVLSNVLRKTPGRVAIYGWHKKNGSPIQPLSTVHGETYADYSHGIRLVSTIAYVNGKRHSLAKLLEDPKMAQFISKEGPIARPLRLLASISTD